MDDGFEPTMTVLRTSVAPPSRIALDRDERLVKDSILRMGSLVESQIRDAIRSIVERDSALAERVIADDERVNDTQRVIADTVVMTIATQSPVARDLRFLMALDPRSTLQIEELMAELKRDYTIVIVTHNMQQAARASDRTVFLNMADDRAGYVVEQSDTVTIFTNPANQMTEDYVSGRFG